MKPLDLLFQGQSNLVSAQHGPMVDFLLFRLDSRVYGVSIDQIAELVRFSSPTVVPKTPDSILGIVGHRGQVLTIVDVRLQLSLRCLPPTNSSRVLVTRDASGDSVGIYVDEVLRVVRIDEDQIEPAEKVLGSDAKEHVLGIVRTQTETFIALFLQPLLD